MSITKDKEGHYVMIQELTQKKLAFVNIYTLIIGVPKYTKQMLTDLKMEIDNNVITIENFNISLTSMDISFIEKISKKRMIYTLDWSN